MANKEVKLIISADDRASATFDRLAREGKTSTDRLSKDFNTLGVSSTKSINEQKASYEKAFLAIKNSGVASADEILRAEVSKNKKIKDLNEQLVTDNDNIVGRLKTGFAVLGAAILASIISVGPKIFDTVVEFERLDAMLRTATGSAIKADAAFADLKDFATETPFELNTLVEAFIKLKNMGLDPSKEALTAYGNIAAAMGRDLNQFIEAVADATVGEFERLKEFGIKAKSEGDKVSFTFQGVTTTIGKNAAEIETYLQRIGTLQFAGAMNEQMETLGGKVSNLKDAIDQFFAAVGENGGSQVAKDGLAVLTEGFNLLRRAIAETNDEELGDLQGELKALEEQIETAKKAGGLAWLWGGIDGLEENKAEIQSEIDAINELEATARQLETAEFGGPQFDQARAAAYKNSMGEVVDAVDLAKKAIQEKDKATIISRTAELELAGATRENAKAQAENEIATKRAESANKDKKKALDDETKAAENLKLKLLELASNENIKSMEFAAQINVAQITADMEKVKANFTSLDTIMNSTGSLMSSLFDNLDSAAGGSRRIIEESIRSETEIRERAADDVHRLTEIQIETAQRRLDMMRAGGSLITIDGSGLEPELEAFMFKILGSIQTRVAGDYGALLLGL